MSRVAETIELLKDHEDKSKKCRSGRSPKLRSAD